MRTYIEMISAITLSRYMINHLKNIKDYYVIDNKVEQLLFDELMNQGLIEKLHEIKYLNLSASSGIERTTLWKSISEILQ